MVASEKNKTSNALSCEIVLDRLDPRGVALLLQEGVDLLVQPSGRPLAGPELHQAPLRSLRREQMKPLNLWECPQLTGSDTAFFSKGCEWSLQRPELWRGGCSPVTDVTPILTDPVQGHETYRSFSTRASTEVALCRGTWHSHVACRGRKTGTACGSVCIYTALSDKGAMRGSV
jgi:hypothetical protein